MLGRVAAGLTRISCVLTLEHFVYGMRCAIRTFPSVYCPFHVRNSRRPSNNGVSHFGSSAAYSSAYCQRIRIAGVCTVHITMQWHLGKDSTHIAPHRHTKPTTITGNTFETGKFDSFLVFAADNEWNSVRVYGRAQRFICITSFPRESKIDSASKWYAIITVINWKTILDSLSCVLCLTNMPRGCTHRAHVLWCDDKEAMLHLNRVKALPTASA